MKNDETTLVVLTPGFPCSEADTTCLPLQQNLVRALKETVPGLNIIILSLQYPYFKKEYKWYDNTVISFNGRNRGGIFKLLLLQKIYKELAKIYRTNKITGILSFWCGECAWIGKRFADRYQLRHYCWILGQDAKKGNKYIKRVKPASTELVALSDFLQNEFEKNHGIRPAHMIPPGVNTKQFSDKIKERDIDILAAGSLIPLKRYGLFIEIIAEIEKRVPGLKVILAGDGPERQNLQKQFEESSLQATISLVGELPYEEVLQLMQRTKIFLHTSRYEGFGVVCIEALYAGAKVISFTKPMNKEIKNWYHVTGKVEMCEKTISLLQERPVIYESVNGFIIEDTAWKMMQLFLEEK